ncbi:hypothetical protein [Pantoea septica]|uniref:hypothetical protein n=1 Tax=Pantoea septica TaxID=472695 RepID=UPI0028D4E8FA|nr:hypothetical protein [Pantoea septica]
MFRKLLKKAPAAEWAQSAIAEAPASETIASNHNDTTLLKCVMTLGQEGVWYIESPDLQSDSPAFFSSSARRLLGLPAQKDVGLASLQQRVHPDHREAFRDFIRYVLSHGGAGQPLRCRVMLPTY